MKILKFNVNYIYNNIKGHGIQETSGGAQTNNNKIQYHEPIGEGNGGEV